MNVTHLQMDFEGIIKFQLQKRTNTKQLMYVNLDHLHTKKCPLGLRIPLLYSPE